MAVRWTFRNTRSRLGYWIIRKLIKYIDNHFILSRHGSDSTTVGLRWEDEKNFTLLFETPEAVHCYHITTGQGRLIGKWLVAAAEQIHTPGKSSAGSRGGKLIKFPAGDNNA